MAIILNPTIQSKNTNIHNFLTFHGSENPTLFYQDVNVPFSLMLVSCHPTDSENSVISFFTPDAQFNFVPDLSFKKLKKNSMHQHNHFEFMYILNGKMHQIVEGKRILYTPGSCCLLNRNTLHTEEYSTDYSAIFFSVSTEFLAQLMNHEHTLLFSIEQNPSSNLIFSFIEQNMEATHKNSKDFLDFFPLITETQQQCMVHNIFEQMLYTLLSPYYGATYHLQDLFCQLIEILCNPQYYHAEHITTDSNMEALLFARIDQLLEEHHGRISNAELALLLNYDGSYLGRIVKKFTGKSLFDYSMTFTIAAAKDMLKHTKKSVSRIAEELHFTNRTHFYKIFYKDCQMTPKQYRQLTHESSGKT